MKKYYQCTICGNLVEVINDGGNTPSCCGKQMKQLRSESTDGAVEKHVPDIKIDNQLIVISVGTTPHPMTVAHHIEWIALETDKGYYHKFLRPTDDPEVSFHLSPSETPTNAYAFCNLHGLWVRPI